MENDQNLNMSKDNNSQSQENCNFENYDKENVKDKENTGRTTFSELMGRFTHFCVEMIKKGNRNYFEFTKEGSKPCKLPITALVVIGIIAFWPVAILLIIGLFCGYKYSLYGPNINSNCANSYMEKAYDKAQDMKNDFNKGYNK